MRRRLDQNVLDDDFLAGVFDKRHSKHGRGRRRDKKKQKHVRYEESSGSSRSSSRQGRAAISKEAIRVPTVAHRKTSRAERLLAAIMTGGTSSIHGLTGKPLLSVDPASPISMSVC